MIYSQALRQGDYIGVCAPSSGAPKESWAQIDNSAVNVRKLGYEIIESASVRKGSKCVSADAKTRAREFMDLYRDPKVKAIIPIWGGEFLMDMLPYLDFDEIAMIPPKWVAGYSDITTLLFPLTLICDIATIHGVNDAAFGMRTIHESDMQAFTAMTEQKFSQYSAPYHGAFVMPRDIKGDLYKLDKENVWKTLDNQNARFSGRIIGGCMDVICNLIGTKYAPVKKFLQKYRDDGFIWTMESCEMSAADIYRTLWQMRECGWFDGCRGFIFGRPDGYSDTQDFNLVDALTQGVGDIGVPVIYDADLGHIPPQMMFVNGAFATVDYANGKATVTQEYL